MKIIYTGKPGRPRLNRSAVVLRRRQRAASNRYWRRVRAERAALGLNSRGGIPRKKSHSLIFQGHELHGTARKNKLQQIIREQRYAAGLTALGTLPQRAHSKRGLLLSPVDRAWRELRDGIVVPTNLNFESVNSGSLQR